MKRRNVLSRFGELMQFMGNYAYYRKTGCSPKEAWHLASMTIPF